MTSHAFKKKPKSPDSAAQLRRRAEARLRKKQKTRESKRGRRESAADTQRLLGELQIHQIELQMQNAELQAARDNGEELLERYTDLYDSAPIGYFTLDEQGRIVAVNLTGATLLGVPRSRLVKCYLKRFAAPGNHPILLSFLREVFSGPETRVCEAMLRRASGTAFWASLHGTHVVSGTESKRQCRVAVTDITPLKQAKEEQRRSGECLRLAAEATGFGAFQYDFARHEGSYTPEFLALFGLPADSVLEVDSDLVPKAVYPDDKSSFLAGFQAAAGQRRDPGNFDAEFRIFRSDGQVRWLRAHGRIESAGKGPHRRPQRANGIIQDITARKQSEQEVAQQRSELAYLYRISTLDELAVSLAHELSQPLAAILSNAQAAQHLITHGRAEINEVREILADIVTDGKRAGEVIRHLRALLKRGEVQHRPLNANEVVQEVLRLVHNDLSNQGIAAQTTLARDLPVFHGDSVQLQQVLLNLVTNACDSMAGVPPHDRLLTICTGLTEDKYLRISIADRGAGIAPEKLEQVFEPFYTTKPNGVGLGLAVCRTIVSAHGGKLWATNNPDRGATFHLTFPLSGTEQVTRDEGRSKLVGQQSLEEFGA